MVKAIVGSESPLDAHRSRLIYADWLEDQGDGRAEYLHAECTVAEMLRGKRSSNEQGEIYAKAIEQVIRQTEIASPEWIEHVGGRFDPTLFELDERRVHACRAWITMTGATLMKAKQSVETAPTKVKSAVTLPEALRVCSQFDVEVGLGHCKIVLAEEGAITAPPDSFEHPKRFGLVLEKHTSRYIDAVTALVDRANLSPEKAHKVIRSVPSVVKSGLDRDAVERFANSIRNGLRGPRICFLYSVDE